jgi:outer membrane protein OmpA-like peptidoglycan-associated protein
MTSPNSRRGLLAGLCLGTAGLSPLSVVAQDYDIKSFQSHTPSSAELIESLKSSEPPSGIKFRSVRPVQATRPKAVALAVQFEFGSAQLTPDAKAVLNNLGQALRSPDLSANAFLIEGHTDSVGSEESNQRLSEARAATVKSYLISSFGIPPSRLDAVGRGETQPLDKANPEAGVNRRVQIVNVR